MSITRFEGPDAGETRAPAGSVPVSAEERRLDVERLRRAMRAVRLREGSAYTDEGWAGRIATEYDAAGVSVPTEPGAPDQLDLTNAHYARTRTHGAHLHPGGPGDGCPEYVVGECVIDFRRAVASQPVPAPEPPYGERVHAPGCSQEWTCPCRRPAPEPSARLREAGDDLYRALSSEHGHGPLGEAPWPSCLPVHIAMNRWLAATPQNPEA